MGGGVFYTGGGVSQEGGVSRCAADSGPGWKAVENILSCKFEF